MCGVISRVKILYNKRDSAMVMFETPEHAENARLTLSGVPLWGNTVLVSNSKHQVIQANRSDLDDTDTGEKLFGEFTTSPLQRYRGASARNVPSIEPTKLLHVSNIPTQATEDDVKGVFESTWPVSKLKFISPPARDGDKGGPAKDRKMALVELSGVEAAAEAICATHGATLHGSTLRVTFSTSNLDGAGEGDAASAPQ
eukprot:CAMPEP_0172047238 /NCGR_PEP_ID=MMETSP1043-20130122/884_1 /TAXON_ID=464988 /ORGANISM="Hemiselmis andersenii, Strain CCMP441" /LENGTH=198 /DNA_ID=CAMNT_0012706043 /DNA_START=27 /DNA_END=621 /DNA_ORIENTATION=+